LAITDSLTLITALAWLDFEFDDYANGQCTQIVRIQTGATDCAYDGLTNQYVADYSGTITFDYQTNLTSSLNFQSSLDLMLTGDYHPTQNIDPILEQDGFTKINLRLALADANDRWQLALIGKNLTGEEIITYANDTPLSANLGQSVGHYAFVEPERTIAVQGVYNF